MANPFTKAWKYLMALFSSKVDEYADPKVQIQQAVGTTKTRRPETVEFLRATVEDLKVSGFVFEALRLSGQADATVASPA